MATRGEAYREERGQGGGATAAWRDRAGQEAGASVPAYAVRIAERYHLEDRISESGQSALWRAFSHLLPAPVTRPTVWAGVAATPPVLPPAPAPPPGPPA